MALNDIKGSMADYDRAIEIDPKEADAFRATLKQIGLCECAAVQTYDDESIWASWIPTYSAAARVGRASLPVAREERG